MPQSLSSIIKAANSTLIIEGKTDAVGDFFAPGYLAHVTGEDLSLGHEGIRKFIGLYQRAFSDLQIAVEILVEGKDRVAWQRTLRGNHTGPFKGFPASGLSIVWRDVVTSRFCDGLIAEEWVISDLAERLLLSRKRTN
jgi:predicted ester cyclase